MIPKHEIEEAEEAELKEMYKKADSTDRLAIFNELYERYVGLLNISRQIINDWR